MMIHTNVLHKGFGLALILSVATLIAAPQLRAQGLIFSGYADFEATLTNPGQDCSDFFFDNHHFKFVALGDIYGDVFAGAEVEYEHAGEEIALEYGYLGYAGIRNLRIIAGKFIVPFGRFNKDLYPTWINKMVDQPHGFSNVFPNTYGDVGVWVSGALPMGNNRVVYDAFVVNGLMGPSGNDIRGMRGNDRES